MAQAAAKAASSQRVPGRSSLSGLLEERVRNIRSAITDGCLSEVLRITAEDPDCMSLRDPAGAAPVHFAFLLGRDEIGKELVQRYPQCTTWVYSHGPYEGENLLHIAIVRQNEELVQWLLTANPEVLNAEALGPFFNPSGPTYFGGYPLLFAVSTNQRRLGMPQHSAWPYPAPAPFAMP